MVVTHIYVSLPRGDNMAIDENKQKALAAALGQIESNLVKGLSCVWVKIVPCSLNHLYGFFIIRRCFRCWWFTTWSYC